MKAQRPNIATEKRDLQDNLQQYSGKVLEIRCKFTPFKINDQVFCLIYA